MPVNERSNPDFRPETVEIFRRLNEEARTGEFIVPNNKSSEGLRVIIDGDPDQIIFQIETINVETGIAICIGKKVLPFAISHSNLWDLRLVAVRINELGNEVLAEAVNDQLSDMQRNIHPN